MNGKDHRRHFRILIALALLGIGGLSSCKRRASSKNEAALNVRVVARDETTVAKVELFLHPKRGDALRAVVQLSAMAGGSGDTGIKTANSVLRGAPGQYRVQVKAFDKAGAPLPGCHGVLTGQVAGLQASPGRVRNAMVAVECAGTKSPLAILNRAPEGLRVQIPKDKAGQHGSFAAGGEASFCLSAWDPDRNALRFEVTAKGETKCEIQQAEAHSGRPGGKDPTQKRCYTVTCKKDFVGRVDLQARVFDQVWRGGSKVDLRGCDDQAGPDGCEGASSQGLSFALKFVLGNNSRGRWVR